MRPLRPGLPAVAAQPFLHVVLTLVLGACSGGSGPGSNVINPPPVTVSRIDVTPASVSITTAQTSQLSATAFSAAGAVITGKSFSFVSSNTSVATVSTTGLVSGVAAGTATVSASVDGVTGSAFVTVIAAGGTVSSVVMTPATLSLSVPQTGQLNAQALDAQGNPVTGTVFAFSTSSGTIATVSTSGLVTAVGVGVATITASANGKSAASQVTVSPTATGSIDRITLLPNPLPLTVGMAAPLTATAYDSANNVLAGQTMSFSSSNAGVVTVASNGVVTGMAVGTATITASSGGKTANATVNVSPAVSGNVIDIQPAVTYQTVVAWQSTSGIGEVECNRTAYAIYHDPLLDRAVNELGLNGVTIGIPSGMEQTRDWFAEYFAGQLSENQMRQFAYFPVNDNSDPFTADPNGWRWTFMDLKVDEVINPLRQRLQARGEKLYVRASYVDGFAPGTTTKAFEAMKTPEEYAETITEAFKHLRSKYGWWPDALDLINEPDLTTPYNGTILGAAGVAAINRLRANGFNNVMLVGPSTTSALTATTFWDAARAVPGASSYLTTLSYHRYAGATGPQMQAIGSRWVPGQVSTMMTEFNLYNYDMLFEDLQTAYVSGFEYFGLAFCGQITNPAANGIYYQINQSNPSNPIITLTQQAAYFRQLMYYVRAGAVRVGATSGSVGTVDAVAFRNTNGKYVAVVRSRIGAVNFTVRGLPAGTYGISYTTPSQTAATAPDQVVQAGGTITASIPSTGLLTIFAK